jgi:hypothetical protein
MADPRIIIRVRDKAGRLADQLLQALAVAVGLGMLNTHSRDLSAKMQLACGRTMVLHCCFCCSTTTTKCRGSCLHQHGTMVLTMGSAAAGSLDGGRQTAIAQLSLLFTVCRGQAHCNACPRHTPS